MNKDHDEDMLLNDVKNLPNYRLSEQQRSQILHNIKKSDHSPKRSKVIFYKGIYAGTFTIVLSAFFIIILFQNDRCSIPRSISNRRFNPVFILTGWIRMGMLCNGRRFMAFQDSLAYSAL